MNEYAWLRSYSCCVIGQDNTVAYLANIIDMVRYSWEHWKGCESEDERSNL